MRILYVVEDYPIKPDARGGGSALAYGHLELLARSGHALSAVVLQRQEASRSIETWEGVQHWVESITPLSCYVENGSIGIVGRLRRVLADPIRRVGQSFDEAVIRGFRNIVEQQQPDMIWAEHWRPAGLASTLVNEVPIIYSHHDWRWRIKRLRHGVAPWQLRRRYRFVRLRRAEEAMVRRVAGCVSGSATEAADIQRLGAKHVGYFPATYAPADLEAMDVPSGKPRIVHLGGMQTTASREGLARFVEVVWPEIEATARQKPELWVVGSLQGIPSSLRKALQRIGAVCTGFVEELGEVLRPFDIHVIPWEYDTGTRTRLPVAFNYEQIVVATQASAACMPEAASGDNCILVGDLSEMAAEVVALLEDAERREQLGRNAREVFLRSFTREALQPRFNDFLNNCYAGSSRPQSKAEAR